MLGVALMPLTVAAQVVVPKEALPRLPLLDRTQQSVYDFVWRSARTIDGWAGPKHDAEVYQEASGSVGAAVLWDEFHGFGVESRFRLDLPLPQVNERLHLFIGRVNPDEFISERYQSSGAFPYWRTHATEEDETLAGLIYTRPERHGFSFSAGGGMRVRSSAPDPYLKTALRFRHVWWDDTLFTLKETVFYQLSEQFGLTSRVSLERMVGEDWRLAWTGSATVTEGTSGFRGFSTLTATRAFPDRRAIVFRAVVESDTSAEVPVSDYGVKVAYRQSVFRDWLILELRTSLTWPKEVSGEPRKPSWGFGIGCEMFFGTDEFSSQPVSF